MIKRIDCGKNADYQTESTWYDNMLNINHLKNRLYIEIKIPDQKYVFLKYGTASGPLADYLPIKVLPLDTDGYGIYEFSCENMMPEEATHIWVSSGDTDNNLAFALIPDRQEPPVENPKFVFYAISDLHTVSKRGKQLRLQAEAFERISGAGADFALMAGDLSNGVQEDEYAILSRQIEKRLSGIPILHTFGNHDFHPNQSGDIPDHQSRIDFRNWLTERNRTYGISCDYFDEYNYSASVGDIHIVSLQGKDYKNKVYSVGDEALSWLENVLVAHVGEKQIVFCHYPLTDHTRRIYLRENKKVRQILERCGNILYFAGHTHDSLDSDVTSIRKSSTVTYINTASVGNTEPCSKMIRSLKSFRDKKEFPQLHDYFCRRSMGIRVEVYDLYYILRGVDFTQNKYIPQCMAKMTFNQIFI